MKNIKAATTALTLSASLAANAGDFSLKADTAPSNQPWTDPASLSYVENGDGTTVAKFDGYLSYKIKRRDCQGGNVPACLSGDKPWVGDEWSIGVYAHRDTTDKSPVNDRGLRVQYSLYLQPTAPNVVSRWELDAKVSVGNTLTKFTDSATSQDYFTDKDVDRETLALGWYAHPYKGSRANQLYFNLNAGVYSDSLRGGNGKGVGRLSGTKVGGDINFSWGSLIPDGATLEVTPVFTLAAQAESDSSATDTRTQGNYNLHTFKVSLKFGKPNGAVPSIDLVRSVGADVLQARDYSTKTEIKLGLTF